MKRWLCFVVAATLVSCSNSAPDNKSDPRPDASQTQPNGASQTQPSSASQPQPNGTSQTQPNDASQTQPNGIGRQIDASPINVVKVDLKEVKQLPGAIAELFDAATGKEVASFDDIQDQIFAVAFHPKENLLAATGKDKTIKLWDMGSKKLVSTTKLAKLEYNLGLQFSTDGTQLAAAIAPRGRGITFRRVEVKK